MVILKWVYTTDYMHKLLRITECDVECHPRLGEVYIYALKNDIHAFRNTPNPAIERGQICVSLVLQMGSINGCTKFIEDLIDYMLYLSSSIYVENSWKQFQRFYLKTEKLFKQSPNKDFLINLFQEKLYSRRNKKNIKTNFLQLLLKRNMLKEFKYMSSLSIFSDKVRDDIYEYCCLFCSTEALIVLIECGFKTENNSSYLREHLKNVPENCQEDLILSARGIQEPPACLFQVARENVKGYSGTEMQAMCWSESYSKYNNPI